MFTLYWMYHYKCHSRQLESRQLLRGSLLHRIRPLLSWERQVSRKSNVRFHKHVPSYGHGFYCAYTANGGNFGNFFFSLTRTWISCVIKTVFIRFSVSTFYKCWRLTFFIITPSCNVQLSAYVGNVSSADFPFLSKLYPQHVL